MKNLKFTVAFIAIIVLGFGSISANAQELKVGEKTAITVEELPEYVVVTSENTKLLGGINIIIDYKKSPYKASLEQLEITLQSGKELRIRNQTDLLNAMSELGFEYVDAYNAHAGTIGAGTGDDIAVGVSDSKFRTNMVFRKKERFRK